MKKIISNPVLNLTFQLTNNKRICLVVNNLNTGWSFIIFDKNKCKPWSCQFVVEHKEFYKLPINNIVNDKENTLVIISNHVINPKLFMFTVTSDTIETFNFGVNKKKFI